MCLSPMLDRRTAEMLTRSSASSSPAQSSEVPHRGIVSPTKEEQTQTKTYSVPAMHCDDDTVLVAAIDEAGYDAKPIPA
jgi:hypothetical protein